MVVHLHCVCGRDLLHGGMHGGIHVCSIAGLFARFYPTLAVFCVGLNAGGEIVNFSGKWQLFCDVSLSLYWHCGIKVFELRYTDNLQEDLRIWALRWCYFDDRIMVVRF